MKRIKILAILSAFTVLSSCGVQYHINQAEKHRDKALKMGAVFTPDTIRMNGDTIVRTYYRNDTLFVEREITKTVYIDGEIRYITKWDKRKEYKIIRQKDRLNAKQKRVETRQENKTERTHVRRENRRSWWWLWLIIGGFIGFFVKPILRHLGVL